MFSQTAHNFQADSKLGQGEDLPCLLTPWLHFLGLFGIFAWGYQQPYHLEPNKCVEVCAIWNLFSCSKLRNYNCNYQEMQGQPKIFVCLTICSKD